ncbi:MAG: nucleotidyltransferase domain-containing protein [Geopsychrobacter sp.]|nr:nucleotidyltransferase domain-containing protein [Geopsychrobacter sp.]
MHSLITTKQTELTQLCATHGVKSLDLFGSAAGGSFDPKSSDLDFLVIFHPMPPAEQAANFFNLQEALEQLFDLPVDLIESAPIRNPYFRAAIEKSRVTLYDAA